MVTFCLLCTSDDIRQDHVPIQKIKMFRIASCSTFVFTQWDWSYFVCCVHLMTTATLRQYVFWPTVQCCRHILYTLRSISNYNASSLVKWYPLSDATHSARVQIPGDAFSNSVLSTYIIYTARDSKLQRLPLSQVVSDVGCHTFGPGSDHWGCIFKFKIGRASCRERV